MRGAVGHRRGANANTSERGCRGSAVGPKHAAVRVTHAIGHDHATERAARAIGQEPHARSAPASARAERARAPQPALGGTKHTAQVAERVANAIGNNHRNRARRQRNRPKRNLGQTQSNLEGRTRPSSP